MQNGVHTEVKKKKQKQRVRAKQGNGKETYQYMQSVYTKTQPHRTEY